ncbi:hypothetical protein A1Q1_00625 [Trichosporon asahii var. asahii CBS 2479]|uniref:Uncharacterized protein n=1 Tax=Trichosporon asahii var. asahii (strain ATCC 90039 / CBS 2479 / JCM 2466 / KCTC 7840 / NBRC 103889/ NCYC 2677 / UAMH 7654) TaxID=1186058 RepID=J5R132_TRIAS|nr:hypothetical protein A1Q1_00625 [Trichosporon asahii var. asahii CBS 2479]EJT50158.1 hypothetical protein A1Q1_00625 [Trichosporon asahii var. asahii CBS 2479]
MGNQRSPAATESNDNNRRAGLDEISAASGEQLTSSTPATAMTNVLSFDKGAWDDRELINAYDASLLEFHATAALAKGQPLPGATAYGSSWYTASKPPEKETRIKKRKKNPYANGSEASPAPNPYSTSASASTSTPQVERASSPTYHPASPEPVDKAIEADDEEPVVAADDDEEGEDEGGYDEQEWPGYEGAEQEWEAPESAVTAPQTEAPSADAGLAYPPPRGHWDASPVSRETALGYALNAQYWAGYWMGVARYAPAEGAEGEPAAKKQKPLRR